MYLFSLFYLSFLFSIILFSLSIYCAKIPLTSRLLFHSSLFLRLFLPTLLLPPSCLVRSPSPLHSTSRFLSAHSSAPTLFIHDPVHITFVSLCQPLPSPGFLFFKVPLPFSSRPLSYSPPSPSLVISFSFLSRSFPPLASCRPLSSFSFPVVVVCLWI